MRPFIAFVLTFIFVAVAAAQQPTSAQQPVDPQVLLDRIQQLEKRIQELENRVPAASGPDNSTPLPSSAGVTNAAIGVADSSQDSAREVVDSARGLHLRAFGQATLSTSDMKDRPTYGVGNFTLLLNSKLSDKFSALAEIALDEDNYGGTGFETVLERAVLQYNHNDYLKISAGRYFSAIGYYNTAFYNADWAQTTMRRPIIAAFQDDGGLAPMQRNGVSVTGRIPSGGVGLHYVAEVGGGDSKRPGMLRQGEEMLIEARTGFNVALYARPRAVPGLQVGGSFFHDTEIPNNGASEPQVVRQNIYSAYVVYNNRNWEFLNEGYLLRQHLQGYWSFNIPAFYTQISRRLTSSMRPYFRFTYLNSPIGNPMMPEIFGHQTGIETGVRYNFSEWVGMKFEYDRVHMEAIHKNINFGGTQLVFTF